MVTPIAGRAAVYTALMGGYETLLEQPAALTSELPFICLTDDPTLVSDTWEIRLVSPAFPRDSVRSARVLKIRGHEELAPFYRTLWIDNSVLLTAEPEGLLSDWLETADFAVPLHSYRASVADEFEAVGSMKIDDPVRVYEQLTHYSLFAPHVLQMRAHWTGILARRHTQAVGKTMELWIDNVLRYSRRDQLSVGLAIDSAQHPIREIDVDNFSSTFHEWPRSHDRQQKLRVRATEESGVALSDDLARLAREIDENTIQSIRAIELREATIAELQGHITTMAGTLTWRLGSRVGRATLPVRKLLSVVRRRGRN